MEDFIKREEQEALQILQEIPQRIAALQQKIQKHCPKSRPSDENSKAIDASKAAQSNEKVEELWQIVADESEHMLIALQKLTLWIQLRVPKISDGNNFGVEVQKWVFIHLKESIENWKKVWDALPDYHNQRATAIEKIKDKEQTEKNLTTTQTQSEGKKDGDSSYKEVQNVEKKSSISSDPVMDWMRYITAVDTKWYFNLQRNLNDIVSQYAVTSDIIAKNKDKILLPRGSDLSSFSLY